MKRKERVMLKHIYIIFFIFFLFLVGCEEKPSDKDVLKVIEKKYSKIGKIENYRRLNTYKTKNGIYVVEYQFDIILDVDKLRNISKIKNPLKTLPYTTALLLVSIQCPEILESDNQCTIHEKTKFVKTQNGWVPVQ